MKTTNTPGSATRPPLIRHQSPVTATIAIIATTVLVAVLSVVALSIVVSTM
ncbi:hypothetical protein [Nocardia brasiliensis]|uniref:hypothetical protein n=1 Tax=Nocardia brasiliensis TaxID=37326 RepID=UPI002458994A|nr:hypothetical protein [Nocardia brasiliensis]